MDQSFGEKLTELLEDTHASHLVLPAQETAQKTHDTFTRLFLELSKQQDLFSVSLKTLPDTSLLDTPKYRQTYDLWVTQLRQESTQRKKLAHHTKGIDSLSSQLSPIGWKTPGTQECEGGTMKELTGNAKYKLRDQINWSTPVSAMSGMYVEDLEKSPRKSPSLPTRVQKWSTPQARDSKSLDKEDSDNYRRKKESGYTIDLNSQVIQKDNMPDTWPTPKGRDWKGQTQRGIHQPGDALENMMMHLKEGGQQDPENNNTAGKNLVLNPDWVAQLMGTTSEKTFFVHLATP